MLTTTEGKMFLAAERSHTETETFRSYCTFNSQSHLPNHKTPFGPLYLLSDETLAGGKSECFSVKEDSLVLILPIVGGIAVSDQNGEELFAEAGQAQVLFMRSGTAFTVTNPYQNDLVNYLQVRFRYSFIEASKQNVFTFDIDCRRSNLTPLFPTVQQNDFYLNAIIGKLAGREEAIYKLASAKNAVMAFVIQGAFELENRLLESRDGLAIWNMHEIELEALSNGAIVLLLELSVPASAIQAFV